MLPIAQHIRVKTRNQLTDLSVLIIEEFAGNNSVLMPATAFPFGTTFPNAEDAVVAARNALNSILNPDKIIGMASPPKEEFVTNQRLAQLI